MKLKFYLTFVFFIVAIVCGIILIGCASYTIDGEHVSKEVYAQTITDLDAEFDAHMKTAREMAEQHRIENLKAK